MSILQRSIVIAVFTGAVAVGVHSAKGQGISGSAGNRPPIGASGNMPVPPPVNPPASAQPMEPHASHPGMHSLSQSQPLPNGAASNGAQGILPGTPAALPPPGFDSNPGQMPIMNQAAPAAPTPASSPAAFAPSEVHVYNPDAQANKARTAILKTSMGEITIKFYSFEAPRTVKNFIDLAVGEKDFVDVKTSKKTRRPFYNGLTFHRVINNFVIQTGCPFGNGRGGPGYAFEDEITPSLKFDKPGIVAMASARKSDQKGGYEPNSNGSQFFITLSPQPELDGKFTIFGEVIKGMDVVTKIASVKTGPTDRPIRRVFLLSVDVPDHKPAPTPTPIPMPPPGGRVEPQETQESHPENLDHSDPSLPH